MRDRRGPSARGQARRAGPCRVRTLAALACGVVWSCGDAFGPPPDRASEPVQTDRTRYTATPTGDAAPGFVEYEFTIVATFTNPTDDTVYLGRCFPDSPGPVYGVDLVSPEDEWGAAYSRFWGCVGHDQQFAVAPGAARVDTLRISGPTAWQGGAYLGLLEGLFRLRYSVRTGPGDGAPEAPDDLESSNVFEVRIEG